ncbi:hypothetical protein HS125_06705 [bacterium]|nr:hypothetical protein [bacterium]
MRIIFSISRCLAVGALSAMVLCQATAGDALETVRGFPEKQRVARLAACLEFLRDASTPAAARAELIKLFAEDARLLSPHYGCNSIRIDEKEWIDLLSEGIRQDPGDIHVVYALTRLLINTRQYAKALEVVRPYARLHPDDQASRAWVEYCELKLNAGEEKRNEVMEFDVHFCVITKNPKAQRMATRAQLEEEIAILNRRFVDLAGNPLGKFRLKSASLYDDVKDLGCPFVALGDTTQPYDSYGWQEIFNQCEHRQVRDASAINIFINDAYREPLGFDSHICHGKNNGNRPPYILLDYARLNNTSLSPEVHEMGHAFGLGHVGVAGADRFSHTNYMCSSEHNYGSGGRRNLGFSEDQAAIMLYNGRRMREFFGR